MHQRYKQSKAKIERIHGNYLIGTMNLNKGRQTGTAEGDECKKPAVSVTN